MCDALPGDRCATETGGKCADKVEGYLETHPDGPPLDPVVARTVELSAPAAPVSQGLDGDIEYFDQVEICHDEDGNRVILARVQYDFHNLVPDDVPSGERATWIDENRNEIEAYLEDKYGAQIGASSEDWHDGTIDFVLPIENRASLAASVRATDGAVDLHNALNGAYGSRPVWVDFRHHLQEREQDIDDAAGAFEIAALWVTPYEDADGEMRELDADFDTSDIAPEVSAQIRADLRDFTLTNRHLIAQAQEIASQRGRTFSMADVGHNYLLSRNGHGTGFWDRGLGTVGDELHANAKAAGEFDLYPGDDGKLYA